MLQTQGMNTEAPSQSNLLNSQSRRPGYAKRSGKERFSRSHAIRVENPYEPNRLDSNVANEDASRNAKRRFLDFRCFATAISAVVLGAAMWKVQSFASGNSTFDPNFFAMLGWFTFCGLVTGLIDPRSPWINWLSVYFGTYILALPFFPRDPLIPLALIVGVILTGICVSLGTLIPSVVAFFFPFKSVAMRAWAGYTD